MEAAQVSINRWVDKTTMGHLHDGILLGHKKGETSILWDSMDGSGEHYAKWNKPNQFLPLKTTINIALVWLFSSGGFSL